MKYSMLKKLILLVICITILVSPVLAHDIALMGNMGSVPADHFMHFTWGFGMQGIFETWGCTPTQARVICLFAAMLKESYDRSQGPAPLDHCINDISNTMLGSFSWTIAKGVNFRLILGR